MSNPTVTSSMSRYRPGGRPLHTLWQVPTFFLGALAFAVVAANANYQDRQSRQLLQHDLAELRQQLKSATTVSDAQLALAEATAARSTSYPHFAGEAHYLFAALQLRRAEQSPADRAREQRLQAVRNLEAADRYGLPQAERGKLWYSLGKVLYQTGGSLQRAIVYLTKAVNSGVDDPVEAFALLTEAHLQMPSPDLDTALALNHKLLESTTKEELLLPARLKRAELFIKKEAYEQAIDVLQRIGPQAPPPIRQRARFLQARASEAEGHWLKAAGFWNELLPTPQEVPGGKAFLYYHLGYCYRQTQQPAQVKDAVAAWEKAWREGGDEGQAAALQLAELRLKSEMPDFNGAVNDLQRALANVKGPPDYRNALMTLGQARTLLLQSIQTAQAAQVFDAAQNMAVLYAKLAAPGEAEIQYANITATWAKLCEERGKSLAGSEKLAEDAQAKQHWKDAGAAYKEAALANAERQPELLWQASEALRRADDHGNAIAVLRQYVQLPLGLERQAEGWYALAEAQWAAGNKDEARQAFYKCIELTGSGHAAKARFRLALDKLDQKDYERAETILQEILDISGPNPDRATHQAAQYQLARLLYYRKNHTKAWVYLREATRLYPDDPQALRTRDQLGDCFRQLAEQHTKKLQSTTEPLTKLAEDYHRKEQFKWREMAKDVYEQLEDDLDERSRNKKPTLMREQNILLAKASCAVADLLFEMNLFQESLRRYTLLARRYKGSFESLIACQRLWRVYNVVSPQSSEHKAALEALQQTLSDVEKTLPGLPDPDFTAPGAWSRSDWQRWLREVSLQLSSSPTTAVIPPP